jgi:hypothetical protein
MDPVNIDSELDDLGRELKAACEKGGKEVQLEKPSANDT